MAFVVVFQRDLFWQHCKHVLINQNKTPRLYVKEVVTKRGGNLCLIFCLVGFKSKIGQDLRHLSPLLKWPELLTWGPDPVSTRDPVSTSDRVRAKDL